MKPTCLRENSEIVRSLMDSAAPSHAHDARSMPQLAVRSQKPRQGLDRQKTLNLCQRPTRPIHLLELYFSTKPSAPSFPTMLESMPSLLSTVFFATPASI